MTAENQVNYHAGLDSLFVVVADLNGDGKQDLAVSNNSANDISLLWATATGPSCAATRDNELLYQIRIRR